MALMTRIKKSISLLLAVGLFSGCAMSAPAPQPEVQPDSDRRTIPYSQMEVQESNAQQILSELDNMIASVESGIDIEQLMEKEESLDEMLESYYTSSSLANLKCYQNSSDGQAWAVSDELSMEGQMVDSAVMEYLRSVVNSPLQQQYREELGEYCYDVLQKQLQTNSQQAVEVLQKRVGLNNEYNETLSNLRVEWNGEQLRIQDVLSRTDIPQEDLYGLIVDYYVGNYDYFSQLYLDMIAYDKQAAAICGYDDAVQWRYDSFGRQYTLQQVEQLFEDIKTYLVPLQQQVMYNDAMSTSLTYKKGVQTVETVFEETAPELQEVWQFMNKYELLSLQAEEDKMSGVAFTTNLMKYDAPFIYMYWGDTVNDAFTLVHEFGHACDKYFQFENEEYAQDLDKSETFSQGLEQVMQNRLANKLGEDEEQLEQAKLVDMLQIICYQAALEDFQIRAYRLDDSATGADLAQLYAQVLHEYGYYSIFGEYDPTWFEVTHFFDAPFYTISYVTSATAALELGKMESEEPGKGLQVWLNMLSTNRDQSFEDFLKESGIDSPFESGRIQQCAEFLEEKLIGEQMQIAA